MTTETVLKSALGSVVIPARSVAVLRESASGWLGLAELHFALAQAETNEGDLDKAIEHTRYMESKLEQARQTLIEARDLQIAQATAALELES